MDWTSDKDKDSVSDTSCWKNSNYQELLLNYLICFTTSTNETLQMKAVVFRAFELIKSFLGLFTSASVKLSYFEKSSTLADGGTGFNLISNSIDTLKVIVDLKPSHWVVSNISNIQRFIESWINLANPKLSVNIEELVAIILQKTDYLGNPENGEIVAFYKFLDTSILNGLRDTSCLGVTIALIESGAKVADHSVFLADLIKTLQKVLKEVQLSPPTPGMAGSKQSDSIAISLKIVNILNDNLLHLGDQRRSYMQSLLSLIELTDDDYVLGSIIEISRKWIFDKSSSLPTVKEKANILTKMLSFHHRNLNDLFSKFLELVADIYSEPSFIGTELTVKLESAFMIGAIQKKNSGLRARFCEILDKSIGPNVYSRLWYIFGVQKWEPLADYYWLGIPLDLCLRSINSQSSLCDSFLGVKLPMVPLNYSIENNEQSVGFSETFLEFLKGIQAAKSDDLVNSMLYLSRYDNRVVHKTWSQLFPSMWSTVSVRQRNDLAKVLIPLLSKEFHIKQAQITPNIIQTLLDGMCLSQPLIQLPPQLIGYLGKTFNSWYTAIHLLSCSSDSIDSRSRDGSAREEERIKAYVLDSLIDLCTSVGEHDMVYGLCRTRSFFDETNCALSFEQISHWAHAQSMYESAQSKARSGVLPFTESEYCLWENNWIVCAQRLQQWDILTDLARSESDASLTLECAWRLSDWQSERELLVTNVNSLPQDDIRRQIFDSFLLLQSYNEGKCSIGEVQRSCDNGVQSIMRQWRSLPEHISDAHIPLMHNFQLFVELTEACQIVSNLQGTNAGNIDSKSQELNGILQVDYQMTGMTSICGVTSSHGGSMYFLL